MCKGVRECMCECVCVCVGVYACSCITNEVKTNKQAHLTMIEKQLMIE